jgi:formylglycine-generating enzyme required for sulfatase activity
VPYLDDSRAEADNWDRKKCIYPTGYEQHPVVLVSWHDTQAYCEWAGGRLPTEAEWEKAAHGGLDEKRYPWGDEIDPSLANYDNRDGTTPVESYPPNGYGLYDMAGNV